MKRFLIVVAVMLIATSAYAMKHRVEIDISFDNKADAVALLNYVETLKGKAVSVEPSVIKSPTLSMPKKAVMYECRHDEVPPQQCSNYENVDFVGIEKVWK